MFKYHRSCGNIILSLVELSVVRMIRHRHPCGYPYGYPRKYGQGADIHTDSLALGPFHWMSIRISVRMFLSHYPCCGPFDQGLLRPELAPTNRSQSNIVLQYGIAVNRPLIPFTRSLYFFEHFAIAPFGFRGAILLCGGSLPQSKEETSSLSTSCLLHPSPPEVLRVKCSIKDFFLNLKTPFWALENA